MPGMPSIPCPNGPAVVCLHAPSCLACCPLSPRMTRAMLRPLTPACKQALDLEQPPNVLGWSMGGMVATSLAALHGDQLGKVRA